MSQPQQSSWAKAADGLQRVVFLFAALMDRLRYATKFMVIGGIVAVPFFALLWLQSAATSERITFADKEKDGIEYIMAAKDFYTQVQRRRVLSVAEVGLEDTSYRGDIADATKQADAAAEKLAKLDNDLGEDLRTTTKWKAIKADWDKVKKETFRTVVDADRGHAKITGGLQELMQAYAATSSNLPIDPDGDISRLLNDFLVGMTLRMDTVARTAFIGLTPAPDTTNQTERNFELTALSQRLGKMPDEVRTRTLRQTLESDDAAEDKTKLGQQRQKLDGQLKTFGDSLRRRFFSGNVASLDKSEGKTFTTEAVAALTAGNAYWKAVGDDLEDSVTSRLRGAQSVRLVATIVGTATVLLLVFLFLGFYASVRRSIDALRGATGRMISGTTENFQLQARDELAEIALAYNEINQALIEARELRAKVARDNEDLQQNILVMLETVAHAAEGDLSKKVPVTAGALGNVADAINAMFESFSGLVAKITEAANRVLRESRDIQQNSDALTSGSTRQLDNIVSATTSIQDMSTTLSRAASSAEVTLEAAENSLKQAANSRDEVVRVVEGMRSIQKTATETLTQLKVLGERTDAITDIVNTITRIAEQSNRLALNAAIEASRAGEHGRGFAVVANEVRRLAERSAEAASEITTVVSTIQNEASQSVRAMSDATRNVEGQLRSAESATKTLEELARFSRQVSDAISQINITAKQQVKGATDVVKTMDVVSNVSKQAVKSVEQTSLTTRRLVELSTELNSAVQQFRV